MLFPYVKQIVELLIRLMYSVIKFGFRCEQVIYGVRASREYSLGVKFGVNSGLKLNLTPN